MLYVLGLIYIVRTSKDSERNNYVHKPISEPEQAFIKRQNIKANSEALHHGLDLATAVGRNKPPRLITANLKIVIPISRLKITIVIHHGMRPNIERETIAVPIMNLSATGSRNFPNSVMVPAASG